MKDSIRGSTSATTSSVDHGAAIKTKGLHSVTMLKAGARAISITGAADDKHRTLAKRANLITRSEIE